MTRLLTPPPLHSHSNNNNNNYNNNNNNNNNNDNNSNNNNDTVSEYSNNEYYCASAEYQVNCYYSLLYLIILVKLILFRLTPFRGGGNEKCQH